MFVTANTENIKYVKARLCVSCNFIFPAQIYYYYYYYYYLLNNFFYSSVYIASNGGAMVNSKVGRMWKEIIMT